MYRTSLRCVSLCLGLLLCTGVLTHCKGSCFVICDVGSSICNKAGVLETCVQNPQDNCLLWQETACPAGQACVAIPGTATTQATASCSANADCTNKYASRKCVGNEVFYFDNCDRQREKFLICKAGTECKGGSCLGEGCNECTIGEQRCTDSGWLSLCLRDPAANCLKWGTPIACPEGKVCTNGKCEKGECPKPCVVGQYRCEKKALQSCVKGKDGCDNWGPIYPCPEGQSCQNDKCAKDVCPDTCSITADCDNSACGTRKECKDGKCIEPAGPCEDKCADKEARCDGVKLQFCRKAASGCLDWAPSTNCLLGQVCKNKTCVQEPCPASCTKDTDCQKAACGAKTSCIKGVCDIPEQVCPTSCTTDSQCNIPNCLTKTACVSGKCSTPGEPPTEPTSDAGEVTPESSPDVPAAWKYGKNVTFSSRPKGNTKTDTKWGTTLKDIINHENPNDPNSQSDPIDRTQAVLRGIHAELRSTNTSGTTKKVGLYLLQGRTIILPEPAMTKDKVQNFVPAFVKSGSSTRFSTFVSGSPTWNDRPLFLYDEWVVHVLAAMVSLDHHSKGLTTGANTASVMLDTIEFTIYALATAMAVKQHDPTYFAAQKQFLEFTAYFAAEAFNTLRQGQAIAKFKNTKAASYLLTIRTGTAADVKAMRDFCKNTFGQKWLDDVIQP